MKQNTAKLKLYEGKNNLYFEGNQEGIVDLIFHGNHKILDIGCGNGNLGEILKKTRKAKEVVGIKINKESAEKASQKLDKIIMGDIENIELSFKEGYFDYILCGDVLEHLIDPWETLKKLRRYLSSDGFLIASIPNVRHWKILKKLIIKKKWEYTNAGILDKGHLRFFTYLNILKLFHDSGFRVCKIFDRHGHSLKVKLFNLLTFNHFCDIFTIQYMVVASSQMRGTKVLIKRSKNEIKNN